MDFASGVVNIASNPVTGREYVYPPLNKQPISPVKSVQPGDQRPAPSSENLPTAPMARKAMDIFPHLGRKIDIYA